MRSGGRLSDRSRRVAVLLALVALVVLAGCSAFASQDGTLEEPGTTPVATPNVTFPDPPASLDADTASETATQYHLALVAQRLEASGTTANGSLPSRGEVNTTVTEAKAGYYALVNLPTDSLDGTYPEFHRAMYRLTEGRAPLSAYPIEPRPVEGWPVKGPPVEPRPLRLVNFGSNGVEATVVLTRVSGEPSTAYLGTVPVDSRSGVALTGTIETAGQYRVTVTAGNRSASSVIQVRESDRAPPIGVYRGPDGAIEITRGPA